MAKLSLFEKASNYIAKYSNCVNYGIRSIYFDINGTTIRLSDHVGIHSGSFSIIITLNQNIVLHRHSSGDIQPITYEQFKQFIRSYIYFSGLPINLLMSQKAIKHEVNSVAKQRIENLEKEIQELKSIQNSLIFGLRKEELPVPLRDKVCNLIAQYKQKNGNNN